MVVVVLCCLGIEVGGFEYTLHTDGILWIQGWLNPQTQNLEITNIVTGTPNNERHEGQFGAFTRHFLSLCCQWLVLAHYLLLVPQWSESREMAPVSLFST